MPSRRSSFYIVEHFGDPCARRGDFFLRAVDLKSDRSRHAELVGCGLGELERESAVVEAEAHDSSIDEDAFRVHDDVVGDSLIWGADLERSISRARLDRDNDQLVLIARCVHVHTGDLVHGVHPVLPFL